MGYLKTRMMINEMRRNFYAGRKPFNLRIDNPDKESELVKKEEDRGNYCKKREDGLKILYNS